MSVPLSISQKKPLPLKWGNVVLPTRYLLAPLAGYTNLSYRTAVRELGGMGLATTDLINARALLVGSKKTLELIKTCPEDRPVAVQIYGSNPDDMRGAAQWLEDYGITSIDINMGCPVNKVTRGGGGSAMMCDRDATIRLVQQVVEAVKIPVTVKMRLGWDDSSISAPFFARAFEEVGAAAVIIHGRTREQAFKGTVNLNGIREVVEAVERIPVIGNGDIRTIEDAETMFKVTGCHGIAMGRGSLLNPWIFSQLVRWELTGDPGPAPTFAQRLDFMIHHFDLLTQNCDERFACLTFRKVANWYCKVLKPGRAIQQRLVQFESIAEFYEIVEQIKQFPQYEKEEEWPPTDFTIKVPQGPISHW